VDLTSLQLVLDGQDVSAQLTVGMDRARATFTLFARAGRSRSP
jgi:hypothetical protein